MMPLPPACLLLRRRQPPLGLRASGAAAVFCTIAAVSNPPAALLPHADASVAGALALLVPRRTAAGHAALSRRTRELTPRQRTTLFMVDGKRSVDIVLALAAQAGARGDDFFELVGLGLVETPQMPATAGGGDSSLLLPSAQSLHGDSTWSELPLDAEAVAKDAPLAEARALLMRAVRSEAPVAGTFTLLRLKRATSRAELEALLDEVEQRLRKPHRRVIAAQMLRHVRHLLTLPANT
jgi:hypothetical protein